MYELKAEGWLKHLDFVILESVCFQTAFVMGFFLRHGIRNPYQSLLYRNTSVVAAVFLVIILTCTGTFSGVLRRGFYKEFVSTLKTTVIEMLFLVLYLFGVQLGGAFSRILYLEWWIFYFCLAFLARSLWKYFLWTTGDMNRNLRSLIIVSSMQSDLPSLVEGIRKENSFDYKLVGVILRDGKREMEGFPPVPLVSDFENMEEYLCHHWVDEVLLDLSETDPQRKRIVDLLVGMGIVVHQKIGGGIDLPGKAGYVRRIGDCPVLTVSARIFTFPEMLSKRLLDILGALFGCIGTILLFLVLGPVIYISSPGPVIFSQNRVGRNGKQFRFYKFRSMYPDAESEKEKLYGQNEVEDGMMFKIKDDPRIIGSKNRRGKGIGHFIRRTSLDEFPQFFNVLKGDMSLVGTRPPTLDEWERYESHHRSRLALKPGITGLWQISGRSDISDFEEVLKMDNEYIENWSFGLDVKILLKTVWVVLSRKGAG